MEEQTAAVEAVLEEEVRSSLRAHGGDVALIEVSGGVVRCRLTGRCSGCPAADLTAEGLIQEALTRRLPWVQGVALVQETSEDLLAQARALMGRHHG